MPEDDSRRRLLIVTADDLGLSARWDDAIARALDGGVLTSTSIVTSGRSYEEAARTLLRGEIDHGVHLDLLDGVPLSPASEIASLIDRRGRFRPLSHLLARFAAGRVRTHEVEREWSAQIERALGDGLRPTHLNGHFHLHLLPGLFRVAVGLAKRFGIEWIRLPAEPPWFGLRVPGSRPTRVAKTAVLWMLSRAQRSVARRPAIRHADCRGVPPGGRAWGRTLRGIRGEVTEIFCHPGQSDGETEALMSADLRGAIDCGFRRTSFRELHGTS
jgi:predicted glycoside hydrolase/deacetylase ChbG (UPF0249 family)